MTLTDAVELYISRRQAATGRFQSPAVTLRSFSRRCKGLSLRQIRPAHVLQFLDKPRTQPITWQGKYSILRMFFEYWSLRGQLKTLPLPPSQRCVRTFVPYIYSRAELRALLDSVPQCQRNKACSMSAMTFRTLLLLLYCTGMRLGEALRLSLGDVVLSDGLITIRGSKFYKSRLVPIGQDLHRFLLKYRDQAQRRSQAYQPFFQSREKRKISAASVQISFRRLCQLASVRRSDTTASQPRLHDLRHTFAVHRLTEWYRRGADIEHLILALSTYLGHVDLHSTQHYLTMTPELLAQANRRFESYVEGGSHVK
jgi:site-specific recombinase XerD